MENASAFLNMSNKELFCTLTGDNGVIPQAALQKIIRAFFKKHPDTETDLIGMVRIMAEEEE